MTLSTPQQQVDDLIRQVAAENDLALTDQLVGLEPTRGSLTPASSVKSEEQAKEDQLARR
jgi:charged multivesicular body protein 1